jgi:hypothetical protein
MDEYRSLQLNVKGHFPVSRTRRLFSSVRYSFISLYYLYIFPDASLLKIISVATVCRCLHSQTYAKTYGLFMHHNLSLFFRLYFYTTENRHFRIAVVGKLILMLLITVSRPGIFVARLHKIYTWRSRQVNELLAMFDTCWPVSLCVTTKTTSVVPRKMDVQEVGWGRGDWMKLGQDRDRWRGLVSTVKNLRVP